MDLVFTAPCRRSRQNKMNSKAKQNKERDKGRKKASKQPAEKGGEGKRDQWMSQSAPFLLPPSFFYIKFSLLFAGIVKPEQKKRMG